MSYPNLLAEMARSGITQKDIGEVIKKKPTRVSELINGKSGGFSIKQAFSIRASLFPDHSVDYLFAENPITN